MGQLLRDLGNPKLEKRFSGLRFKFLHRYLTNLKWCTLYSLVKIFFQYYLLALVQVRINANVGLALLTNSETSYCMNLSCLKQAHGRHIPYWPRVVSLLPLILPSSHGCQSENFMGVLNLLFPSRLKPYLNLKLQGFMELVTKEGGIFFSSFI